MTDDFYKKQLEAFGIESVRITKGDINKKRSQERQESMLTMIRLIMDRVEGRQWLYTILDMCRVFTSPFVPGQPDVTAFFSGAQALGHKILADIMVAAPQNYYLMISEEESRKQALEAGQAE
jgi:hypothetical protein